MSGVDWNDLGRELLQAQCEHATSDLREAFARISGRLDRGEKLQAEDVEALRTAMQDATIVQDYVARACPDTEPHPKAWDFLDQSMREKLSREHGSDGAPETPPSHNGRD